jgi:hypothetical protein
LQRKTLARSGRQGASEPKVTNGCSDTVRKLGKWGRVEAKVAAENGRSKGSKR